MLLTNFGTRLKVLREKEGYSQERFAVKAGIDRTYYASAENGKRNVSLLNLNKIAKGFGMSLAELLEGVIDEHG